VRAYDRWRSLDRHAKRLSLEAAALTALSVARVTLRGAPRVLLGAAGSRNRWATANELRELAAAIERASRHVPGAGCLPRALALQWMLKRRGIAADIRLGVRTDAGTLSAHAWVECQGIALGGPAPGDSFAAIG
jgi:aryl-alcohol dehydrogenase-like predicted oxidoreductase